VDKNSRDRSPIGRNTGIGVAIGMGIGIAIGVGTDNLAVWSPIGVVLGLVVGTIINQRTQRGEEPEKRD